MRAAKSGCLRTLTRPPVMSRVKRRGGDANAAPSLEPPIGGDSAE